MTAETTDKKLIEYYKNYYNDQRTLEKRKISALQAIEHLKYVLPLNHYKKIIDIGAGEGSLLEELDRCKMADEFYGLEISESGCKQVSQKTIPHLKSIEKFDGYSINAAKCQYDLGIVNHVLEHVEHERQFLKSVSRVCENLYIEVPLELSFRPQKNIRTGRAFGHLNFYNELTFQNILLSSGLEIIKFQVFSATKEYEAFISGKINGRVRYVLKNALLATLPKISQGFVVYMAGALCKPKAIYSDERIQ